MNQPAPKADFLPDPVVAFPLAQKVALQLVLEEECQPDLVVECLLVRREDYRQGQEADFQVGQAVVYPPDLVVAFPLDLVVVYLLDREAAFLLDQPLITVIFHLERSI